MNENIYTIGKILLETKTYLHLKTVITIMNSVLILACWDTFSFIILHTSKYRKLSENLLEDYNINIQ